MEMESTIGFWVAMAMVVVPLLWWWNDYWYALPYLLRRAKLPPGYMGMPFVGETAAFLWYFKILRRPDEFINAKRSKYGDGVGLYRTYIFGSPTILACSPSANKMVLQSGSNFGVGWSNMELVGRLSLVAVEGAAHTRVRDLVQRAINQPDSLRKVTLAVQPLVAATLKSWSQRGRITVLNEAKKLTLATIGMYFASIEEEDALEGLYDLVKGVSGGLKAYPLDVPGTALHHALKCRRKAKEIFREEMEKRNKSEAARKNDLMEELMRMKDEEGKRLSKEEVIDNIVSLVVAGYASTPATIMWALHYLANYPNVLHNLREEHMRIGKGGMVTYEEISSCKYTSKVVEEIIRVSNVSTFILRTATKDVHYKGYTIPKGWKVACWLRYAHTNPDLYEDPMCFNPNRWNEAPKAGSWLVFGGGARTCPGNMFARLQLALLLHHLVLGYKWKLVNPNVQVTYIPYPKPDDEVEIDITAI